MDKSKNSCANLYGIMSINREPCTHNYSFRNFAVQGEGQHQGATRECFIPFFVSRVCYVLFLCWCIRLPWV